MKLQILSIFLFINIFPSALLSQTPDWTWVRSGHGNFTEMGTAIGTDASNNLYVCGISNSSSATLGGQYLPGGFGGLDFFYGKFDPTGNLIWTKRFGGLYNDNVTDIKVLANGNFFITGTFQSASIDFGFPFIINNQNTGDEDIFIAYVDSSGDVIWANSIGGTGGELSTGIASDATGNVYLTGMIGNGYCVFGNDTLYGIATDGFIAKYDINGNLVMLKQLTGNGNQTVGKIRLSDNGSIILSGSTTVDMIYDSTIVISGPSDFLASINSSGNISWITPITNPDASPGCITVDSFDNIYMYAQFQDSVKIDNTTLYTSQFSRETYIAKFDDQGSLTWLKSIANWSIALNNSCVCDMNGNNFITGIFEDTISIQGNLIGHHQYMKDFFVARLDTGGNVIWIKDTGSNKDDYSRYITLDEYGVPVITGGYESMSIYLGAYNLLNTLSGVSDLFVGKLGFGTPVIENFIADKILIFPNPSSRNFRIWSEEAVQSIIIVDELGREIFIDYPHKNNLEIILENAGLYNVILITAKGRFLYRQAVID
ncbi:MAG: hypothetical protein IPP27_00010 [Bacteroidetes bacterium]|nr:hypothetical protein [Bacteroidota bacterium]MBP6427262.1 hypothetical protein [Bacteroidia bacterium]MBP6656681.1 hypothetical protein [Bacteroidia bacterium]